MRKVAFAIALLASPAAADQVTILAMGDSLTAGFGLSQGEGFVPQLQAWLTARGHDAVVINAGVSGDTTAGGLARVGWALQPDVDAMILALGGNDLLRGLPPEAAAANLDGILDAAHMADVPVLLAGLEAPLNYGADYKAAFEAIFPTLAADHGALLFEDFLLGLRAAFDAGIPRGDLMLPDGIHPTALGISHMVDAIGPVVVELIAQID